MSRIGRQPITIPDSVKLDLSDGLIKVAGPKGELSLTLRPELNYQLQENQLTVSIKSSNKLNRSLHGTFQRLISNMIIGVTEGYQKNLELVGTGYRVAKQGNNIVLSLGLSHTIEYNPPSGVNLAVEGNNKITVSGIDKQQVGQAAANIRAYKTPEPYKGKGIRYQDEVIRRKAGKTAKASA